MRARSYLTDAATIATYQDGMITYQICIRMLYNVLLCGTIMVNLDRVGYLS